MKQVCYVKGCICCCRMEETVRSLLQYKSRVETLKQEKASLSSALEVSYLILPALIWEIEAKKVHNVL